MRKALRVTSRRLEELLERAGAEYGLFWTCDETIDVLHVTAYHSLDGALMERSSSASVSTRQCAVGRSWSHKEDVLVRDACASDIAHFRRVQLACYHGVHSVACWRFADGVLELGTRSERLWAKIPDIDELLKPSARPSNAASSTGRHSSPSATLGAGDGDDERPPVPLPLFDASSSAGITSCVHEADASYGIFWSFFAIVRELKAQHWYAPDGKCMQRSCTFGFLPGQGAVGRVWSSGWPQLLPDVQALPPDDFLRVHLAKLFGVRSIALIPFEQGVLELGTCNAPGLGCARAPPAHARVQSFGLVSPASVTSSDGERSDIQAPDETCAMSVSSSPTRARAYAAQSIDGRDARRGSAERGMSIDEQFAFL
ncbi:hypothetical protein KFE25_010091 [Diacronema lutheri]|uniref:Transcription factor MYC/MYB N-terminal domain-containing protein n=1 Tax=Diacronema lutheri TaxID=2081491 RepID=A0A8J6CEM1_DIALT|nr:hypothetical protein KFE25_010091 [Diacronema lutheri]